MMYGPYEALFYLIMDRYNHIRKENGSVTLGYIHPDVSAVIDDAKTFCRLSDSEWHNIRKDVRRHHWIVFWPKQQTVPEVLAVPAARHRMEFGK